MTTEHAQPVQGVQEPVRSSVRILDCVLGVGRESAVDTGSGVQKGRVEVVDVEEEE
jgi:hypothetical protein